MKFEETGGPFKLRPSNFLLLLMLAAVPAMGQPQISVRVAVEKREVVVGEPFRFQIQIEGTNDVQAPDLAARTDDFDVEFLSGKQSNSRSIQIVNGRTTELVERAYYLDYRMQARHAGTATIPSAELIAGGKAFTTQPVSITVTEPKPNKDFFLTSELSKDSCYVGECIYLTTTLFFGRSIEAPISFHVPLLALDAITSYPLPMKSKIGALSINGEDVDIQQTKTTRNGRSFDSLIVRHALIPQHAGTLTLPKSTVSAQAATGRRVRTRSFFGGSREEFAPVVVTAESVTLTVKPLPDEGKPADFSGLVGDFTVSASASPTTVNVGDPITLKVSLGGSAYMKHIDLPPLQQQTALMAGFRMPDEMASSVLEGTTKHYTQTIRAQSADITEVPPITLSYFDSESGTYKVAASKPIPLTVRETKMVTADDAEGYRPGTNTVEHIVVNEGIAHNYTDASALKPQRFGPNEWLQTTGSWLFLLVPPFLYFAVAAGCFVRRRGGLFVVDHRQRPALPAFEAALGSLDSAGDVHGPALDALRTFLGTRLERQASALTYGDIKEPLRTRGIGDGVLDDLKALFDECEAHRYAGGTGVATENAEFVARVLECVRALDKEVGR
ncbi:MAG: BatD family protein [Candidatus Hydrogenedentes bacterium]|nr:BatD family protein [Candidatus Hydrogenedentota bacterium]